MFSAEGERQILPKQTNRSLVGMTDLDVLGFFRLAFSSVLLRCHSVGPSLVALACTLLCYKISGFTSLGLCQLYIPGRLRPPVSSSICSRMVAVDLL